MIETRGPIEPESPSPGEALASVDAELLARVNHVPGSVRKTPEAVTAALGHCSKQFQLWDVKREEISLPRVKGERIERQHPIQAAGEKFEKVLAEATHAMTRFSSSSELAKKGFTGYRALKRVALNRPYKSQDS
jgi:hypothetical protein